MDLATRLNLQAVSSVVIVWPCRTSYYMLQLDSANAKADIYNYYSTTVHLKWPT